MTHSGKAILAFLAIILFGTPSHAQDQKITKLGTFGDWHAESYLEKKGKKTCLMWTMPLKSRGKYRKRGEVYMYVTHRPWLKKTNVVSFVAGYKYKKDSEARALVGGAKFVLFTDSDVAWARNAKQDRALVGAMRRGRTMTLDGLSSRSTRTTDIYSLTGFSAAHDAISKACGVK